jgi:DMSO/TMAO reductase YedYZ molybdopterin-dependent catalytic subunit
MSLPILRDVRNHAISNAREETMNRRELLLSGAMAGVTFFSERVFAQSSGGKVIPWSDQPAPIPPPLQSVIKGLTPWEDLDSQITPNNRFFSIAHYNRPQIDAKTWHLDIAGQVNHPSALTLDSLKAMPREEVTFTLECSGDNGLPFFQSGVGNARWAGASLAEILRAAQIKDDALEVVFFGADQGEEVVHQATPLEYKFTTNFARSMPIADAMSPVNMLCYEMNGELLPTDHGFPCRLIAPGWFGVANVKWLTRIEVVNRRFLNRFMGRDYVTIREEQRDGKTIYVETSVGRQLIKSAPARVIERNGRYQIQGMAWGPKPIATVEVKIDNGGWTKASLAQSKSPFEWQAWSLDWSPTPGDHSITSRATDTAGTVQPAMDDPVIANKKTYWESNGQITRHARIA